MARRLHVSCRRRSPALLLAVTRIAQAPGFAAIGMAGIVASFALMIAMATMVASFRDSVDDWLTRILPAQLYVRAAPGASTAFFSAADIERIKSHPGVERVDFSRAIRLQLDPQRAQVTLTARPIDIADPGPFCRARRDGAGTQGMPPPTGSEPMVDIRLRSAKRRAATGGPSHIHVAGVWLDTSGSSSPLRANFGILAARDLPAPRRDG